MLWRMLRQSRAQFTPQSAGDNHRFSGLQPDPALLAVSIDIGDKMSRELKSYGANILIEPAGQAALPALFSESSNPLSGQDFLDEAELPNIKDIFWRNNIVGFAPMLGGEASVEENQCGFWALSSVSQWIFLMKRDMRRGRKRSAHTGR